MTSVREGPRRRELVHDLALDYLACGLDPERSILDSINHELTGHASVGRDLSSTLDELEEALHTAG